MNVHFDDSDDEAEGDEAMEDVVKEEDEDDEEGGVEAVFEETLKAGLMDEEVNIIRLNFCGFFFLFFIL